MDELDARYIRPGQRPRRFQVRHQVQVSVAQIAELRALCRSDIGIIAGNGGKIDRDRQANGLAFHPLCRRHQLAPGDSRHIRGMALDFLDPMRTKPGHEIRDRVRAEFRGLLKANLRLGKGR